MKDYIPGVVIGALVFVAVCGLLYAWPKYRVWQQNLAGQAALARATQDRQIRIEEAKAKLESEKLNARSEVERAKGLAEANEIVIKSLGTPDAYLRYLWVNKLSPKATTVYLPTEAGLPILEARRKPQ